MTSQPFRPAEKDPRDWSAVIAVFFLALVCHRLGVPAKIYFDELHYVNAARLMLEWKTNNPEHPALGKAIIAGAIALLGDKPLYWRVPSALMGALGLYAFARAMWFASGRRFATLAAQFLLATSFAWFIQSRIAMLDMAMACLAMVAFWMFTSAMARPAEGRWRLAVAGLCLGLAMGVKWSVAPIAVLPGLAFLVLKVRDCGWRFLTDKCGGPVPGISLIEAAFWLGSVPLAVYWATFLPTFFYVDRPVDPFGIVQHHRYMLDLQDSVKKLHPYRSVWYQWMGNWRAIWYLYENVDGAQRGVLLVGNPFSMLAGLAALGWGLWATVARRRHDVLAFALPYVVLMAFWAITSKPIQFYYHYLLPGTFLMGLLALALDDLRERGGRWAWAAWGGLAAAGGMFAWFYPIISAARLHDAAGFQKWMWLKSWI